MATYDRADQIADDRITVIYRFYTTEQDTPDPELAVTFGLDLIGTLAKALDGGSSIVTVVLHVGPRGEGDVTSEAIIEATRLALQGIVLERSPASPRLNLVVRSDATPSSAVEQTLDFLGTDEAAFVVGSCLDLRDPS